MNVDFQMAAQFILVVIGIYLAFFKSYFQEKGRSLATSQDIENITRKVESVKKELEKDFAKTKSKIDLLYNLELDEIKNEKTSIIRFHKIFSEWFNTLTNSLNIIDETDNNEIRNKMNDYDNLYTKVLNEFSLLELYLEDNDLIKLIDLLKIKILTELAQNPQSALLKLIHYNEKKDQLLLLEETKEKYANLKSLREEKSEIFLTYGEQRINGLKKVIEDYVNYVNKLKEVLKYKN